jgi:tRNA nucleotidyltransferase (CCA-adding enzyme)
MSDYMFMLENHLSSDQNRVVSEVQAVASASGVNVFLTGGALRDMLGGFAVRDLDFSVEGQALKVVDALREKTGARVVSTDENRRTAEMIFPGGVSAEIALSRHERYPKTGGPPQVAPATIQEDLRRRDFSINAVALSLNRASRGLLLDPTNGLADLERRELRALGPYTFHDDPSRLLRLARFRVRLGFTVEERTRTQYDNARNAELHRRIPPRALFAELRHMAEEPAPGELVRTLAEDGLLSLFSPALAGSKLNLPALAKLEKTGRMVSAGDGSRADRLGTFLFVLTEKLTPREKAELIHNTEMTKTEVELWQKIETRSRKLEKALKSARIRKPSQVYQIVSSAPGDEVCFVLTHSPSRPVQDRLRNYFQKYLPLAQEFSKSDLSGIPAKPGTARYQKSVRQRLATHLDRRPRKVVETAASAPAPVEIAAARGRLGRFHA